MNYPSMQIQIHSECITLLLFTHPHTHTQYTLHDPGEETGTIPADDFVVHPIDDQHRPSHVISIGEPSHIGM